MGCAPASHDPQRNALGIHVDRVFRALVAAIPTSHCELAANRRALLVDAAAHPCPIERTAPTIVASRHHAQPMLITGDEVVRYIFLRLQYDGQAAADSIAAGARDGWIDDMVVGTGFEAQ